MPVDEWEAYETILPDDPDDWTDEADEEIQAEEID